MAKQAKLSSMSVESLFKLRDEVAKAISDKASDLQRQLSRLTGSRPETRGRRRSTKGRKVAPQFRSKKDPKLVWSGRGATPRWMREEMKGTKLTKESFRIKG